MPSLPITDPFIDSNRTLIPRGGTHPRNSAYAYNRGPRRVWIDNLVRGLKYASSRAEEFQYSLVIQKDDPNAGIFAGRSAGGGRRVGIYGNTHYGSGYPNNTTEGVIDRDFPFFFFPISYGQYPGYGSTFIFDHEYGPPGDKHRPGGPLHYITIRPPKPLTAGLYPEIPPTTQLFVIADKPTLKYIRPEVKLCGSTQEFSGWFGTEKARVSKPRKFKGPAEDPDGPAPEQAVGYFRASSVVLSLLEYNNTAQFTGYTPQNPTGLVDTPLPQVVDTDFFRCINSTLGNHIPLVIPEGATPYQRNAASLATTAQPEFAMLLTLVLVIWHMVF